MSTTSCRSASSQHSSNHRNAFAEAALGDAFRGRDLSLAREPYFVDRQPHQQPKRLGDIAAKAVGDVGQAALDHWLRQAARTRGQEREVALQIAHEIADMIGVPWAEIMSEQTA